MCGEPRGSLFVSTQDLKYLRARIHAHVAVGLLGSFNTPKLAQFLKIFCKYFEALRISHFDGGLALWQGGVTGRLKRCEWDDTRVLQGTTCFLFSLALHPAKYRESNRLPT